MTSQSRIEAMKLAVEFVHQSPTVPMEDAAGRLRRLTTAATEIHAFIEQDARPLA